MSEPTPAAPIPPTTGIRDLSRSECEAVLARHSYGRLAFAFRGRVDIEPISFVYEHGWIVGRTSPGTKLTVLTHHPWVAFEVDEVDSPFSWRSVVAKGTVYLFNGGSGGSHDPMARDRAMAAIQRLAPTAFTAEDPYAQRTVLFRIHVDELHGRESRESTS